MKNYTAEIKATFTLLGLEVEDEQVEVTIEPDDDYKFVLDTIIYNGKDITESLSNTDKEAALISAIENYNLLGDIDETPCRADDYDAWWENDQS